MSCRRVNCVATHERTHDGATHDRSNWQRRRRSDPAPSLVCPPLRPSRQVPVGRWRSAGLQRAHHHSRPEERPASHHARGDHRGLGQALGLGAMGRGPVGPQSARGRPRDHHVPAARAKRSARPNWMRRSASGSSATSSVRSREASRSVPGSFARSMASISTIPWMPQRVDRSSSCARHDDSRRRTRSLGVGRDVNQS